MLFYMYAIKRFVKQLWSEPHTVFMASLFMLLLSMPVVTLGLALSVGVHYIYCRECGIGTSFKMSMRAVRPVLGRAILMGLVDIACVVASFCSIIWIVREGDFAFKFMSMIFLYVALFHLGTGLYRYPALVHNSGLSLGEVFSCGMSAVVKNLGYTFLYWCLMLLVFMLCAVTGVGLILILPGCFALLMTVSWSETLKREEHRLQKKGQAA